MDYTITSIAVNDIAAYNAALQPAVKRQVSFYVGKRGPFYLTYAIAEYTPERVIADVEAEVSTLKAIDAGLEVI